VKGKLKLSQRERILAGGITLSLVVATYNLGYKSQQKEIASLQETLQVQETELQKKQETLRDLQTKSAVLERANQNEKQLGKYIEASKYMSNLLRQLGAEEGRADIHLRQIDIKETTKVNNLYRSSLQLEVESSFLALGRFLASLEKSDLLIEVKSLQLNRIDSELKRCQATIEVQGYFNGEGDI